MKFKVKGIELYSEKEAKITLEGKSSSLAFLYVPVETVKGYWLGQEFRLEEASDVTQD